MHGLSVLVYSKAKDGNLKLSNNFRVREFACNDGSDVIFIAPKLVEVLQAIRDHFKAPVTINSGYRSVSYNKKVKGAQFSQHQYGTAADIQVSGVEPKDVYAYVEKLMPKTGGIGLYDSFTHVDVRTAKSRWKG